MLFLYNIFSPPNKKESVQNSEKDIKLFTNADPKEEGSSKQEVNDTIETDANTGSKEEE